MKENAAWYLRRYRDGALPDWRMRQVLEWELYRLVSDHSALHVDLDEIRHIAPERLVGFDTASDQALQCLGECHFGLALKEIQRAERELAELRCYVNVASDWQRVNATLAGVEDLLSPEFESHATARVLRRLRDLARSLLDQGETRKARFVVLLLAQQVEFLLARQPGELKAGFERLLSELEAQDEKAATRIRKLGREGYHHLAERLAEDLEAELAISDRMRRSSLAGGSLGVIERDLAAVRRQAHKVQTALAQWLEDDI